MAEWHPIRNASPIEWDNDGPVLWYLANGPVSIADQRYAIIRRLTFDTETWYRATTWAQLSENRQLLGYFRDLHTAAAYAWQDHLQRGREMHAAASTAQRWTGEPPAHERPPGFQLHVNDE